MFGGNVAYDIVYFPCKLFVNLNYLSYFCTTINTKISFIYAYIYQKDKKGV